MWDPHQVFTSCHLSWLRNSGLFSGAGVGSLPRRGGGLRCRADYGPYQLLCRRGRQGLIKGMGGMESSQLQLKQ